jgi:hypothetical protein
MSLHDKYLRGFDFNEVHHIDIDAPPQIVYPLIKDLDFSESWIIRMLFFIRDLPVRKVTISDMTAHKFLVLEALENEELIIGLIGQFWKPTGNLQPFEPEVFETFDGPFAKATWNFAIKVSAGKTQLSTETRIACPDLKTRKAFSRYWFFIRPFSGLIRREMLRAIRIKAESQVRPPYV